MNNEEIISDWTAGLSLFSGIASITAILAVFICYISFKEIQVIEFRMIMNILIGDFILTAVMIAISAQYFTLDGEVHPKDLALCQTVGFLKVLGGLISFTWSFNVSYTLKQTLYEQDYQISKTWQKMQIASFAFVTIMSLLPFTDNAYGVVQPVLNNTNCFIKYGANQWGYNSFEIACFYGPLWLFCAYSVYAQIMIQKVVLSTCHNPIFQARVQHLKLYPMVMIFCYTWVSIYRVLIMVGVDVNQMSILVYFFQNLNGLLNSIVYCYYILGDLLRHKMRKGNTQSTDYLIFTKNNSTLEHLREEQQQISYAEFLLNSQSTTRHRLTQELRMKMKNGSLILSKQKANSQTAEL